MKKEYADATTLRHTPIMYSYPVKIVSKALDKQTKLCYNECTKQTMAVNPKFVTYKPEEWRCRNHLHSFSLHSYSLTYFS